MHATKIKDAKAKRQVFYDIIERHLTAKDKNYQPECTTGLPGYVVAMLDEILQVVQRLNPAATFADVMRLDGSASGHTNYHTKAAMYFQELSDGIGD